MDLNKVRNSEWVAGIAGLVILISMFGFNWYEITTPRIDALTSLGGAETGIKAWESQGFTGTIANLVILAAALSGIALAVLAATSRTVALPVAAGALTAQLGAAAVVMTVLRMLFQPGPNVLVDLKGAIFVALGGCVALTYGAWRSMEEEMAPYTPAGGLATEGVVSPEQSPLAQPPAEEAAPPPSPSPPSPGETQSTPE